MTAFALDCYEDNADNANAASIDIFDNWQSRSACATRNWENYLPSSRHDPEIFFPKRMDGGQCAPAKSLCAKCPVRRQCLTFGLKEPTGVWGGLSEKERRTAQQMVRDGRSVQWVLEFFDAKSPKRRRKTSLRDVSVATPMISEQYMDVTGMVPSQAVAVEDVVVHLVDDPSDNHRLVGLEVSPEVKREMERRRNGL